MANRKLTMLNVKEILRLHNELNLSERSIAKTIGHSRTAVRNIISRGETFTLSQVKEMTAVQIEENFFSPPRAIKVNAYDELVELFPSISRDLSRKHVTLFKLWEEYKEKNPKGYSRSQFCHHYAKWIAHVDVSMPIVHRAGENMFVDFAGDKLFYIDKKTGKEISVEVFVSILPASLYTYMECMPSQKTEDWIRGSENSIHYFGGVPISIVPDNAKAVVSKANKYEPKINPHYQAFAEHYSTVIRPARVRKPKDKALVENAVGNLYTSVYASLRDQQFFSIKELNDNVKKELIKFNQRVMKKYAMSRMALYKEIEEKELRALPVHRYEYMDYVPPRTVPSIYHLELPVDKHYYSVPYRYKGLKCKLFYNNMRVDIYHKSELIATHKRNRKKFTYSTTKEHMPHAHQFYASWSSEKFIKMAKEVGTNTFQMISQLLEKKEYPQHAFKSCLGILELKKKYGEKKLERGCLKAMEIKSYTYHSVLSILKNKLYEKKDEGEFGEVPLHKNIREKNYYSKERQ